MEQIPDHPVIRWMERTGYPPPVTAGRARRGGQDRGASDGEELYGDPARLP